MAEKVRAITFVLSHSEVILQPSGAHARALRAFRHALPPLPHPPTHPTNKLLMGERGREREREGESGREGQRKRERETEREKERER